MSSKNFGRYLNVRLDAGWFKPMIRSLRSYVNNAFTTLEAGSARTTIPFACFGSGDAVDGNPIIVDPVNAQWIAIAGHDMNYGLGYWNLVVDVETPANNVKLYAVEGLTSRNYRVAMVANVGNTYSLVWADSVLTIKVPLNNSGTVDGLRTALLADEDLATKFTVSSALFEGTEFITTASVFAAVGATVPTEGYGKGISAMACLLDLPLSHLVAEYVTLFVEADLFGEVLSGAYLPCTLTVEMWQDGQLTQLSHLAIAAVEPSV